MKKIFNFILLLIVIQLNNYSQIDYPEYFEDYHFPPTKSTKVSGYSPNGIAFTPKGDLKILIITVGFGEPYDSYPVSSWPEGVNTLPNWVTNNTTFYENNSQFNNPESINDKKNLSRFYYAMSKGDFRITADIYPTRINIDPAGLSGYHECNAKVIEKMKIIDPSFNWSSYDTRKNFPDFEYDYSNINPDMIVDYVVFVYRFHGTDKEDNPWYDAPMKTWLGSAGGYASIDGLSNIEYNGFTFHSQCGYTHGLGSTSMFSLFLHEVAHSLYDCPHYSNANGVVGEYFYGQSSAWGMMNPKSGPLGCANGWERWYLGWIELEANGINSDINSEIDLPSNGEFILRDHIITGDVVRIKLPNGQGNDQYLWIENHQGLSIYDDRLWVDNGCGEDLPPSTKGIVAYIEGIAGDRNSPFSFWWDKYTANGIEPLHSQGNYDYVILDNPTTSCILWGNDIYNIIELEDNPIAGQTRIEEIRYDINNNGEIFVTTNVNSPTRPGNEQRWIAKRNGIITYDLMGTDIYFRTGQKIGMSTNPPLLNRPRYDKSNNRMGDYYLNGISVEILSRYSNGNIKIKVRYDDIYVNTDLRWKGNIILPDITNNANPDLILSENKKIKLNKSGTPNRHTKNNFNEFVNPTLFKLNTNSFLKMQARSKLIADENTTVILESSSKLEINDEAVFQVKNGATLHIKNSASLIINGNGRLEVENGGYICIEQGANLNLVDGLSVINFRPGYIVGVNTSVIPDPGNCLNDPKNAPISGNGSINIFSEDIYIQNDNITSDRYISGKNIFIGRSVTTSKPQGDVIISDGAKVVFDAEQNIHFKGGFIIENPSSLDTR